MKVKPLKRLKRQQSVWSFPSNRWYEVVGKDSLDGNELFIIQTGATPEDYDSLYADEFVCDNRKYTVCDLSFYLNEFTGELELYIDNMLDRTYSNVYQLSQVDPLWDEWVKELLKRGIIKEKTI